MKAGTSRLWSSSGLIPEIRSRQVSRGRDPRLETETENPRGDTQAAESKAMAKLPLAPRGEAEPRSSGQEAGLGQGAGDKEGPVRSGVGVRAVGSIRSAARLRL